MRNSDYLIIDFDSTFVELETLEEIASETLKENPDKQRIEEEIKEITDKGMSGKMSFHDSLKNRLQLFSPSRKNIDIVTEKNKNNITDSFLRNKNFFREYGEQIFVVSGGFKECIVPISKEFGIPEKNVLANEFIFNNQGNVVGIDENNLASQNQGKIKQVKQLDLRGSVFAIGDGWTDYEIKKEGQANFFLAFTENVRRGLVVELADREAKRFEEVIDFINEGNN